MSEQTGRTHDTPPAAMPDDQWQADLQPTPLAGRNVGLEGEHPEKDAPTAADIKAVHRHLHDLADEALKHIPILPAGTRLEQGAAYIDLRDTPCREFKATGNMSAGPNNWYVPKSEVDYQLWNRLLGVDTPARLGLQQ